MIESNKFIHLSIYQTIDGERTIIIPNHLIEGVRRNSDEYFEINSYEYIAEMPTVLEKAIDKCLVLDILEDKFKVSTINVVTGIKSFKEVQKRFFLIQLMKNLNNELLTVAGWIRTPDYKGYVGSTELKRYEFNIQEIEFNQLSDAITQCFKNLKQEYISKGYLSYL